MGEGLPVPLEPCLPLSLYSTSAGVWFSASRSARSSQRIGLSGKSPLLLTPERHRRVQSHEQRTSLLVYSVTHGVNEFILVTQTIGGSLSCSALWCSHKRSNISQT